MMLDDQIIKTQSMRASPYIGPFEDRVRLWEVKLNMTQVGWASCCFDLCVIHLGLLDQWLRFVDEKLLRHDMT